MDTGNGSTSDKRTQKPRKNGKVWLYPLSSEQALEGLLDTEPPKGASPDTEPHEGVRSDRGGRRPPEP